MAPVIEIPPVIYSWCALVKHRDYYHLQITAAVSSKAADDLTQSEKRIAKKAKLMKMVLK